MNIARSCGALMLGIAALVAHADVLASTAIDHPLAQVMAVEPDAAHPILVRVKSDQMSVLRTAEFANGPQRARHVVDALRQSARTSQEPLLAWLTGKGISARPYWLGNLIGLSATPLQIKAIAARNDVEVILLDRAWKLEPPTSEPLVFPLVATDREQRAVGPSLAHIRVPEVWATGVRGQGVVIGGQDTGYQWDHPALRESYRGWGNGQVVHDYNWHDAVHQLVGPWQNLCGLDSPVPCDDDGHGTHTMGTMVGDDGGANQIGVAPAARWIGCRSLENFAGTTLTYTECFQWLMAPTRIDGSEPDPERAPHIINNSWYCNLEEGCTPAETALMEDVVESVRAAGILVVGIAGNFGPACGSVGDPPGTFPSTFTVGATLATSDSIAGFSSRGPTPSGLLKPDISAPGATIRSSVTNGTYATYSGTSMAAPHVAGTAALLMSVNPALRGNPAAVEAILKDTSVPLESAQDCGGYPGISIPNAVFGHGRIDAWAAFRVAETIFADSFD